MGTIQRERCACSQTIVAEWAEKPEGFMLTPVKRYWAVFQRSAKL